jgi:alkylhydroperoxidase family enzyme
MNLPGLDRLAPSERAALTAAVEAVRHQQRHVLQQSIDAAMEHVPRVLRGALRKVLFK